MSIHKISGIHTQYILSSTQEDGGDGSKVTCVSLMEESNGGRQSPTLLFVGGVNESPNESQPQ